MTERSAATFMREYRRGQPTTDDGSFAWQLPPTFASSVFAELVTCGVRGLVDQLRGDRRVGTDSPGHAAHPAGALRVGELRIRSPKERCALVHRSVPPQCCGQELRRNLNPNRGSTHGA